MIAVAWDSIIVSLIGGLFGGGLLYLAARSKTKGDVKVALTKVKADHETENRSVAIEELEASLIRLSEENKQLRADQAADRARIGILEAEYSSLRKTERECKEELAFLKGKLAVLETVTGAIQKPSTEASESHPEEH